MADTDRMDVGERTKELVHVQFDLEHGHGLLEFGIMATSAIDSFWNVFEDEIEVNFIFLKQDVRWR
jgi:hypothetical protein